LFTTPSREGFGNVDFEILKTRDPRDHTG